MKKIIFSTIMFVLAAVIVAASFVPRIAFCGKWQLKNGDVTVTLGVDLDGAMSQTIEYDDEEITEIGMYKLSGGKLTTFIDGKKSETVDCSVKENVVEIKRDDIKNTFGRIDTFSLPLILRIVGGVVAVVGIVLAIVIPGKKKVKAAASPAPAFSPDMSAPASPVVPTAFNQAPVDNQQMPVFNQAPVDNQQMPVFNQAPVDNQQMPVFNQAPVDNQQMPVFNQAPVDNQQMPIFNQAPVSEPAPVFEPQVPVVEQQTPVVEQQPAFIFEPQAPVSEPAPVFEPQAPVSEPAPVFEPQAPVSEPAPVFEPQAPASEPAPVFEPQAPVSEPAPVFEPQAPVSETTQTPLEAPKSRLRSTMGGVNNNWAPSYNANQYTDNQQ